MIAVIAGKNGQDFEKAAKKASLRVNEIGTVRGGGTGEAVVRYV